MWQKIPRAALVASFFLVSVANALPHDDDDSMEMEVTMELDLGSGNSTTSNVPFPIANWPMSYFAYGKHSSTIIAHIVLMVLAWCFVLPSGE